MLALRFLLDPANYRVLSIGLRDEADAAPFLPNG